MRIGIHTGHPALTSTGYVGLDVPRAARICAAGHGGQVLLSQATRELVEDELPTGVAVRDLGEHRLKDLTRAAADLPARVDGLAVRVPAAAHAREPADNLPVQATPLIGREREVAQVARAAAPRRRAPADADRARRRRQDAARAAGGRRARRRLPARRLSRRARADRRPGAASLPTVARTVGLARRADAASRRVLGVSKRRCCSCSTTSSRCWTRRPSWATLLAGAAGAEGAGHEPRAAAALRRARVPGAAARPARPRAPPGARAARAVRRRRALRRARAAPSRPTSPSRRRTRRPSPRSASASTGCRWRSSWRPRARSCSRRRRCSPGSSAASSCSPAARATCRRASRRCARRSTGATTCSARTSGRSSRGWPSSSAAARWRRPRRSAAPSESSTGWRRSSTRACCARKSSPTASRASRCSRRSASTPSSGSRRAARRKPSSGAGTPSTSAASRTTRPSREAGVAVRWPTVERELDNLRAALDRIAASANDERAVRLVCNLAHVWQTTGHLAREHAGSTGRSSARTAFRPRSSRPLSCLRRRSRGGSPTSTARSSSAYGHSTPFAGSAIRRASRARSGTSRSSISSAESSTKRIGSRTRPSGCSENSARRSVRPRSSTIATRRDRRTELRAGADPPRARRRRGETYPLGPGTRQLALRSRSARPVRRPGRRCRRSSPPRSRARCVPAGASTWRTRCAACRASSPAAERSRSRRRCSAPPSRSRSRSARSCRDMQSRRSSRRPLVCSSGATMRKSQPRSPQARRWAPTTPRASPSRRSAEPPL